MAAMIGYARHVDITRICLEYARNGAFGVRLPAARFGLDAQTLHALQYVSLRIDAAISEPDRDFVRRTKQVSVRYDPVSNYVRLRWKDMWLGP